MSVATNIKANIVTTHDVTPSDEKSTLTGIGTSKSEAAVKAALLTFLRKNRQIRSNSTVVSELSLDKQGNRADIVLLNKFSHGFEIKTKRDKLIRLDRQMTCYLSVFDFSSAVVASRHMNAVMSRVPEEVGLYEVHEISGKFIIKLVRAPIRLRPVDQSVRISSLPLPYLKALVKSPSNKSKREDFERAAALLPRSRVRRAFNQFLGERFQANSTTVFREAMGRDFLPDDVSALSLWRDARGSRGVAPQESVVSRSEWETYRHLSASFGPVPTDIRLALSSPSIPLQSAQAPHENGPVDEDDC